jgi:putative sterol carrier protein
MTARDFIMNLASRFNPEAVPNADSVFHFKISGEGGGDFTASVKDGICQVVEGLTGEAKCVVSTTDSTLVDIVTGKANAQMAVFMGKLKISNLGEMMKFAKPFGLM